MLSEGVRVLSQVPAPRRYGLDPVFLVLFPQIRKPYVVNFGHDPGVVRTASEKREVRFWGTRAKLLPRGKSGCSPPGSCTHMSGLHASVSRCGPEDPGSNTPQVPGGYLSSTLIFVNSHKMCLDRQ